MREGVLPPHEGEAHESDGAGVPLVAEAPGVFEAEATEATAPKTAETIVAAVDVSASTEATMAEAGAPETVEAIVMAVRPSVQEVEMKAVEASVVPLVQGPLLLRESAWEAEVYPISSDDTSQVWEMVDVEDAELGSEASRVAEASRVEAQCLKEEAEASQAKALRWKEKAEAYQVETRRWEQKAKESEVEVTQVAEASSAVQMVLETEIKEHEALKLAALSAYEALEVEGV
ncbi:uncharacterized protein [Miscanthus floridulus]|uniref:uncharacterized protein n=1 Tax=Miscanthus floridulus TaxID=154761 RepID=UPI003458FB6A